jgi:hypothetical protein
VPLGLFLLLQRPTAREALIGAALLGWVAWSVAHPGSGFPRLEAAWVCLLASGVAVVMLLRPPSRGPLIASGLLAVGLTAALAVLAAVAARVGFDEVRFLAQRHYGLQARLVLQALAAASGAAPGTASPALATFESTADTVVLVLSRLLPGLVLLQSTAALAAAWALYRLLARHPEGESLPRLKELRFNDHLVWGVVLALLALVVPWGVGWLRPLGSTLATFFGALYVARGLGILMALGAAAGVGGPFAAVLGTLAAIFLMPLVLFSMLALGVTDTWIDWRRLAARAKQG